MKKKPAISKPAADAEKGPKYIASFDVLTAALREEVIKTRDTSCLESCIESLQEVQHELEEELE